jgi:hypothetical protein
MNDGDLGITIPDNRVSNLRTHHLAGLDTGAIRAKRVDLHDDRRLAIGLMQTDFKGCHRREFCHNEIIEPTVLCAARTPKLMSFLQHDGLPFQVFRHADHSIRKAG